MRVERKKDVPVSAFQNRDDSNSNDARELQSVGANSGNDKNSANGKDNKNGEVSMSISGANLTGESLVAQRMGLAKKQALKVVSDAFDVELKIDTELEALRDNIHRLQEEIYEEKSLIRENEEKVEELRKEYGVSLKSKEYNDISKVVFHGGKTAILNDGEIIKATEFQQRVFERDYQNMYILKRISDMEAEQRADVDAYSKIKIAREKSHNMIDVQETAEDIMDSAYEDAIVLLTDEAVGHIDEEQKEREEEAKEQEEEKKEAKKEKAEKLEKEARRQEMIENIKERAELGEKTTSDVKRANARKERMEADSFDVSAEQKVVITDASPLEEAQDEINREINAILDKLKLISDDIKGATVDSRG